MVAKMDWSMAFWSVARALVIFFFCIIVSMNTLLLPAMSGTYLGLLSLLEESLLGLLLLSLLLGEVFGRSNLLEGLAESIPLRSTLPLVAIT